MKIAVLGLGYVGVVSATCLARDGHDVIGVDPNAVKTDSVNQGTTPIVEPGLGPLISAARASGRLSAVSDPEVAVRHADILFICVGTPGHANGSLDLGYVRNVCEQIGAILGKQSDFKVITVRSTMLPGSMEAIVIPTLEQASGKVAGRDFGVCINPEFLREGTAIYDYDHPPKTVIGASDSRASDTVRRIYGHLDAPMIITSIRTAEMVKYVDNAWHALKVTFANEVGRLSKAMQVDSREVMRLFVQDRKLNLSSTYLRPGFAFGGSCLPKDVRALMYSGRSLDVDTPMLRAVVASNNVQIDKGVEMIRATGKRRIGLLGLSFKEGTDDLRESPVVTLAEKLIGKGFELSIYDRNVRLASIFGANRDYILNHIPHIGRLMVETPLALIERCDVVVLATGEKDFGSIVAKHAADKAVVDLVGIWQLPAGGEGQHAGSYDGIAW